MNERKHLRILGILAAFLLAAAGCDQSTSTGTADPGTATDVPATDPGTAADTTADAPAAPKTVKVKHGDTAVDVDLSKLPADPFTYPEAPGPFARLSDVVAAADAAIDPAKVSFDLEDTTGYRPGSKANCAGVVPFPGANLAKAHIDTTTRNVKWDEDLGYPGCASVKDTAVIEIQDE